MTSPTTENNHYDRETELKQFDSSKLGVKGLLDTGIKTILRIFHQTPENLPCKNHLKKTMQTVPVIDMSQDRVLGLTPHTDPGVLTMLVQNEVGGLLHVKCGDDVKAVPGATVINIGYLLELWMCRCALCISLRGNDACFKARNLPAFLCI
ncbi:1-aminocyclopropane-1-carboxylate oxidase homolog 3-like protein [Tanacetum coccineum]